MISDAILIVHKGSPYDEGAVLPLRTGGALIGRTWQDHIPDIAFDDPHISRSHAEISYENDHFVLRDLPSSKHGTEVNRKVLNKGEPYILEHNDIISLAGGAVVLRFCCQTSNGKTLDVRELLQKEDVVLVQTSEHLVVDSARREVLIDGKELRPRITGREYDLIDLLYQNRGNAVSHEEIIDWVWRSVPNRETITRQDVNTLVHRLRKCLGEYGANIVNIASYGYRLD